MLYKQYRQRKLSQPAFLILSTLNQSPYNGVGLCEAIQQMEGLVIEPGTLYRALAHLEQRGWIEADDAEAPLRLYRIAAPGILALEHAEVGYHSEQPRERWHPLLQKGKEILVRFVIWMLCLYPLAWRERYEQEMIALLEQHQLTLWTVLDLFIGALDARLDPHYRRKRQFLPMLRLQVSWKWFFSAVLVFCFSLLFWPVLWGADFPCNGDAASCALAHTMGAYNASLAATIVGIAQLLMIFSLFPFLLMLLGWIGFQARRTRDLLRTLPVALLVLLCLLAFYIFTAPDLATWLSSVSHTWWFESLFLVVFLTCVVLVAESAGTMFISLRSWQKRHHLLLATLALAGMVVVCIATGAGLIALWNMLPQLNDFSLGMSFLPLIGFITMVVATVIALIALVRSTLTLRAASTAPVNASALPQRDRTGPKDWIIVLPAVVFSCIELTLIGGFGPFGILLIPLLFVPGSVLFALAVKHYRLRGAALAKQEPFSPVQQVHKHN
jgi:DNA-binding PadR family transcriptional regulator